MNEQIYDIIKCDTRVLEMVSETTMINVPIHPSINIDVITADDPEPRFVNVEVIRGGTISGNNRRYNNENVRQINKMVPGVQGFLGHPDPSKYGFEFREPQCIFVGSMLDTMEDGSVRCIAKCYLFKSSRLREWIPKSIAANNPMTVSINGRADVIRSGEYIDVVTVNDLESIDWANPGTEGISSSKAMSVVREMENNNNGGNTMEVKDILKNATVTEFKAFNPDGYSSMVKSISLTELQAHNPDLVKAIEDSARISEMKLTIGGAEKVVKLTEMQGIVTDLEGQVATAKNEAQASKLTEFKTAKIAEMIPEELREQVAKRVTGDTEDAIVASINAEIGYIREMKGLGANDPIGRQVSHSSDSVKESVARLFGSKKD
jgi:hypothetical protein